MMEAEILELLHRIMPVVTFGFAGCFGFLCAIWLKVK